MAKTLVLGVLPNADSADSAVNNLTEQGFGEHSLSVVMRDAGTARRILAPLGPLGTNSVDDLVRALSAFGMTEATAKGYVSALEGGAALLAVSINGEAEARAVEAGLNVYNAQMVTVLG